MPQGGFASWLGRELEQRGWSQRELARRAGLSQTTVSQVIAEQRESTFEFCVRVAQVLGRPPVDVFRQAGLLPFERPKELEVTPTMKAGDELVDDKAVLDEIVEQTVATMGKHFDRWQNPEQLEHVWSSFLVAQVFLDQVAARMGWVFLQPRARRDDLAYSARYLIGVGLGSGEAAGQVRSQVLTVGVDRRERVPFAPPVRGQLEGFLRSAEWDLVIEIDVGSAGRRTVMVPDKEAPDRSRLVVMVSQALTEGYREYAARFYLPPPASGL